MRLLKMKCPDYIGAGLKVPQDWGIRGLIEIISAISLYKI